jgi:hypothetical protein
MVVEESEERKMQLAFNDPTLEVRAAEPTEIGAFLRSLGGKVA